ncbi:hypothetical protein SAMN05192562_102561 [Kosakonia arachidis]|uniref:Uncharacterized protein n=1 Tax=Kosakonia arachidis TaxID=551989 RepID=A0A1I7BG00_9ENTR|nr:hypothetical protein SAMN05192562_102561 [Kosakonia arachidis]
MADMLSVLWKKERTSNVAWHGFQGSSENSCDTFATLSDLKTKKPLRVKWLNHMILKLKFGGPCWV